MATKLKLSAEQRAFLRTEPAHGPNKIRVALRAVGATQKQLSDAIGIDPTHLSRIVNGTDLALSTAKDIADALGVGLDDIFRLAPKAATPKARVMRQAPFDSSPRKAAPKAPAREAVA